MKSDKPLQYQQHRTSQTIENYESDYDYTNNRENCSDDFCRCSQSEYWAGQIDGVDCSTLNVIYWYHPDYLGNNEFITDFNGNTYQYFFYSPWGESLVDQYSTSGTYSSSYRFSGKELDQETSLDYFGFRYYNPNISVWLSVDMLASNYSSLSPYTFVANNPVMLFDPDGRKIHPVGLSEQQKQLYKKQVLNLKTSYTFSKVYNQLSASKEIFNIEAPKANSKNILLLSEVDGYFEAGANDSPSTIALNQYPHTRYGPSNPGFLDPSTLAEEMFHAGQYMYGKRTGFKQSNLSMEVEARVFRAYLGFENQQDRAAIDKYGAEPYVYVFLSNDLVQDYFSVISSGNAPTATQEKSFRNAVKDLAKQVNDRYSGIEGWSPGENLNNFNGGTSFFDELTKCH